MTYYNLEVSQAQRESPTGGTRVKHIVGGLLVPQTSFEKVMVKNKEVLHLAVRTMCNAQDLGNVGITQHEVKNQGKAVRVSFCLSNPISLENANNYFRELSLVFEENARLFEFFAPINESWRKAHGTFHDSEDKRYSNIAKNLREEIQSLREGLESQEKVNLGIDQDLVTKTGQLENLFDQCKKLERRLDYVENAFPAFASKAYVRNMIHKTLKKKGG